MSELAEIPELDRAALRQFAITTSLIVVGLFGLLLPWVFGISHPEFPWWFAVVLSAWGLVAPGSLRPVYRAWMSFGLVLHRVTSPLLLGAVFFLVITPVALAMRLVGKDPLRRKIDKNSRSYRIPSTKAPRENMEKPF